MFKSFAKIFLILLLIFVLIVAFSRHSLCRFLICSATAKATGLELSIEELNLNVLNSSLYMGGITLFNPPGFRNEVLGKAKEIVIKYDLLAFASGRLHLRRVKADISEINIIRNAKGNSNVSALRKRKSKAKTPSPKSPTDVSSAQKKVKRRRHPRPKYLVDKLELSLEKVTFINYQAGVGEPAVVIFTVKGPCVFKNVSNLGQVVDSVSAKGGFRNLLNNLAGVIARPQDVLKTTTEAIKKKIKDVLIHKAE